MGQLVNNIQHIFEYQSTVFKLNLSFGFVLFNNETQQMQYHHASANNSRVCDSPFQIRNREDLAKVRETMQNIDIHAFMNGLDNNDLIPNGLSWILPTLPSTSPNFETIQ
jgi:hypothetical protein